MNKWEYQETEYIFKKQLKSVRLKNTISHIEFLLKGGSFAITQKNKREKNI